MDVFWLNDCDDNKRISNKRVRLFDVIEGGAARARRRWLLPFDYTLLFPNASAPALLGHDAGPTFVKHYPIEWIAAAKVGSQNVDRL